MSRSGSPERRSSSSGLKPTPEERDFIDEEEVGHISVGGYVATRLVEAGVNTYFTVPGDFTLGLLDALLKAHLKEIGCCNELNAGYAADGYARATGGLGVVVVTYMVGGLSVINAVAGAYSDDLPVLCISGGPNTHDSADRHLLHHTLGETELYQSSMCFKPVVAETFVIRHIKDAPGMIDRAILTCQNLKKPVYLEIPCNLVPQGVPIPSPLSSVQFRKISDPISLDAATEDIIHRLTHAVKPVLIAGPKLLTANAIEEFGHLANAIGCGVATLPNAKSFFSENHPLYMGTYWAGISSAHVREIVESCDLIIIAGGVLNDYVTCGWTALLPAKKVIDIQVHDVAVCKRLYSGLNMSDLLSALAAKAPLKESSLQGYRRYRTYEGELPPVPPADPAQPLTIRELKRQVQESLTSESSVIVETGDSWFIGQYLKLPEGAKYHWQMQYGSIGWSVGASLGISLGVGRTRKPIVLVGDGSFQLTAQEVSTMIRYHCKLTMLLINNRGYTIEVQIHDGPYNDIKNWDYAGLMNVFNAGEGNGLGIKARNGSELAAALARADKHDGVTLIECVIERDDCTAQLLEFGSKVSAANMRP